MGNICTCFSSKREKESAKEPLLANTHRSESPVYSGSSKQAELVHYASGPKRSQADSVHDVIETPSHKTAYAISRATASIGAGIGTFPSPPLATDLDNSIEKSSVVPSNHNTSLVSSGKNIKMDVEADLNLSVSESNKIPSEHTPPVMVALEMKSPALTFQEILEKTEDDFIDISASVDDIDREDPMDPAAIEFVSQVLRVDVDPNPIMKWFNSRSSEKTHNPT